MGEKLANAAFTEIEAPAFGGKPEVLSVKIPGELKRVLRQYGKLKGRRLSEVAQFALEQYAKNCSRTMTPEKPDRAKGKRK